MMKSCVQMAEKIAEMSPVAVQGTKINLNYARDHSVQVWYFRKVYLVHDIKPPNRESYFPIFFHEFFSVQALEKVNKLFIGPKQFFLSFGPIKVSLLFHLIKQRKNHENF